MELYDKLTAIYPAEHFSTSTTQTVIDEEDHLAITRAVTFEHSGIEILKIDKTLFVLVRDASQVISSSTNPVKVCDGAIASEIPSHFIGYVELKSKCSQNEVLKARSQIMASRHHMLTIAQDCAISLTDYVQKGIIITQPIADETLTKARQRRQRDDDLKVVNSSSRFLLKLIEGKAKDEDTGICFVHAVVTGTGVIQLKDFLL